MAKCIECGSHVPPYQKYFCEECWKEAPHKKILEEDDSWTKPIKKESK